MKTSTRIQAGTAVAVAVILISAGSPAGARQQAGTLRSASIAMLDSSNCPLARVGTEYVRCDNLTGAGIPAPSWVPELKGHEVVMPVSLLHGTTP
jgi:hypothetical protein